MNLLLVTPSPSSLLLHSPPLPLHASKSSDIPRRQSLGRLISQSTAMLMASIGSLILMLALLILFHENANATKGYQLRGLEHERSMLLLEQEIFNMQIAEAQSLQHLKSDPLIDSMLAVTKPTYVQSAQNVALRQN